MTKISGCAYLLIRIVPIYFHKNDKINKFVNFSSDSLVSPMS
jgi:hypothetical protein